jgi:hypothetical protein
MTVSPWLGLLVLDANMTADIATKGPILTHGVAMLTLKILGGRPRGLLCQ